MSLAGCCGRCDVASPQWRIERRGDAIVSWSCDLDLSDVCADLQRPHEITELVVTDSRKRREIVALDSALDRIANSPTESIHDIA